MLTVRPVGQRSPATRRYPAGEGWVNTFAAAPRNRRSPGPGTAESAPEGPGTDVGALPEETCRVSEPRPDAVIVLAAGEGTRMKSRTPKVLHALCGRSMLGHALAAAGELDPRRLVVVVGHGRAEVRAEAANHAPDVCVVVQERLAGTGHAVRMVTEALGALPGIVMVTYGDMPLLRARTLGALVREHAAAGNAVTVLTARVGRPHRVRAHHQGRRRRPRRDRGGGRRDGGAAGRPRQVRRAPSPASPCPPGSARAGTRTAQARWRAAGCRRCPSGRARPGARHAGCVPRPAAVGSASAWSRPDSSVSVRSARSRYQANIASLAAGNSPDSVSRCAPYRRTVASIRYLAWAGVCSTTRSERSTSRASRSSTLPPGPLCLPRPRAPRPPPLCLPRPRAPRPPPLCFPRPRAPRPPPLCLPRPRAPRPPPLCLPRPRAPRAAPPEGSPRMPVTITWVRTVDKLLAVVKCED